MGISDGGNFRRGGFTTIDFGLGMDNVGVVAADGWSCEYTDPSVSAADFAPGDESSRFMCRGKGTATTCSMGDTDTFSVTKGVMECCDSTSELDPDPDPESRDRDSNDVPHGRPGTIFRVAVYKTTFTSPESTNTVSLW